MAKIGKDGRFGPSMRNRQRRQLLDVPNPTCALCLRPVDPELTWPDLASAVVDHVVPLARGGDLRDVQLSHRKCNDERGSKTMDEWWAWKAERDAVERARAAVREANGAPADVTPDNRPVHEVKVTRRVWGTPAQQAAMLAFRERPGVGLL